MPRNRTKKNEECFKEFSFAQDSAQVKEKPTKIQMHENGIEGSSIEIDKPR